MDFDNIDQLFINNKEVQQLSLDGNIIWSKGNDDNDYELIFSLSNDDVDSDDVSNVFFDLVNNSYKIYLTSTRLFNNNWLSCSFIDSNQSSDYDVGMSISPSYEIDFLNDSFNLPSNLSDTINVLIEMTPNIQKLYINNNLVATNTHGYDSIYYGDYNYLYISNTDIRNGDDGREEYQIYTVTDISIYEKQP